MTFVYFIGNERRRLVKIGTSDAPGSRLITLQAGTVDELRLLALVPGDERYEAALHARFAEFRVGGEWFSLRGELADLIALLPTVDEAAKAPRQRLRQKPSLTAEQRRRIKARNAAWLAAIRDAVTAIGIGDVAEVLGVHRTDLSRAFHGMPGRPLRYEWFLAICELDPKFGATHGFTQPGSEEAER